MSGKHDLNSPDGCFDTSISATSRCLEGKVVMMPRGEV